MQSYFFPYIGYFQLIHAVDKFVIYDDVNYIKQGWINRNRILLNGKEFLITLKLDKAGSFKLINNINIIDNKTKMLKTIKQAYCKAPYFSEVFSLLEKIFHCKEQNLSKFLINSIVLLCKYLDINTKILISSDFKKDNKLKGEAKVIHICKLLKADQYINAIGGMELYSKENFKKEGIDLKFIKSKPVKYEQFDNEFVTSLSIIDVLMFNHVSKVNNFLNEIEYI